MEVSHDAFFKPLKLTDFPCDEDYKKIQPYINAAQLFSHGEASQMIYLIDYYKRQFVYVSDTSLFLCGNSPEEVLKLGYNFYLKYVPKEDLELLLEINTAGFLFYSKIPEEDRLNYQISYNVNFIQPNKHLLLVNHKLIPYVLDKSSNIWLALCIVSTSSADKAGNALIQNLNTNETYLYDALNKAWKLEPVVKLTRFQKEVLTLSSH